MAAAALVAACGEPDATSSSSSVPGELRPPVAVNAAGGSSATVTEAARPMAAGDDASTELTTMPAFAGFTYEIGDGLPALPPNSTAYQFPAGADVDEPTVAALAEALGVAAPERVDDPNTGLLWKAGPDDGTAPFLGVSSDPQLSWYFSAAWTDQAMSAPCAVAPLTTSTSLPGDVREAPQVDPATTTTSLVGGDAVGQGTIPCPAPEPPPGVPTAAEAESAARDLLAAIGQDPAAFELETYADEWSASVVAWPSIDGVRWPVSWGFTFGGEGVLQGANGSLAEPIPFGPYPLVDLDTAVVRLGQQGSTPMVAVDIPTDTIEPVPGLAEPEVATLVDVRPDFWWAWDPDGSVWLLPAYTFIDTQDRPHTVPAISDEYLVMEPPATTVPPTTLPPTSIAPDMILGLNVDEATRALAVEGLTLRVVREDGVDLIVTDDLREDRLNVAVEAGVVTEILGFG